MLQSLGSEMTETAKFKTVVQLPSPAISGEGIFYANLAEVLTKCSN